jgi:hypothetical protein
MRRQALEKLVQDLVRAITTSDAETAACCATDSECCPDEAGAPQARATAGPVVVICQCTCSC